MDPVSLLEFGQRLIDQIARSLELSSFEQHLREESSAVRYESGRETNIRVFRRADVFFCGQQFAAMNAQQSPEEVEGVEVEEILSARREDTTRRARR